MAFVLDASVAGVWMFQDELNPQADIALDLLREEPAIVPAIWWFEVRNMLALGERRGRISGAGRIEFLAFLKRLPIDAAPLSHDDDILELAHRHRLTFYDASYCELARREDLRLAMLDSQLAQAARKEGVLLLALG